MRVGLIVFGMAVVGRYYWFLAGYETASMSAAGAATFLSRQTLAKPCGTRISSC
jgi:hypothetical protein